MQIYGVVGQHKANAFMLAKSFAEGLSLAGIAQGNIVGTPGLTQPPHTMGETRWRQTYLGIPKALADLTKYVLGWHTKVSKAYDTMTTRKARINGIHSSLDDYARLIHISKKHSCATIFHLGHDDCVICTIRSCNKPFPTVDDVVISIFNGCGLEH